ncbi:hypothetical protein ACFX12_023387 [Malus domestica]
MGEDEEQQPYREKQKVTAELDGVMKCYYPCHHRCRSVTAYSCISHYTFWVQLLALINYTMVDREGSNAFVNLSDLRKDELAW